MEQSCSWENNNHSASQDIPHLLWNLKFYYYVYKNLLLFPVLSQMHLVHTSQPCFPKIYSTITLPSMPTSYKWSFSYRFSTKILYAFLISPIHATCPAHPILLHLIVLIMFGEAFKLWSSLLCSLLQPPATSSLLGSNILLITLFTNTLDLSPSLSMRDHVSHPYKTKSKIIVLYILIYF